MAESQIHYLHDPSFDAEVAQARTFTQDLGLRAVPSDKITVISAELAPDMRRAVGATETFGGGYNPETDEVLILENPDPGYPESGQVNLRKALVHELAHGGTHTPGEHAFFREALAGVAEFRSLEKMRRNGLALASDYVVRRAGVALWLPGTFRAYERPDIANSTQALIAARGLSYALMESGLTSARIFHRSRLGSPKQYDLMKGAVDAIHPGLSDTVMNCPETTDGIIQATAAIEGHMRQKGHKLPDLKDVDARFRATHQ
ncbi:MAG TPA: hypothetical protein VJR27_00855 [Candidatus Saccharimonadales bacterium]|nr:hypothetical protein [Candidatus Saccharimonadales bacterium]